MALQARKESRAKVIAAVVLLIIAAVLLGSWFFGSPGATTRVSSTPTTDEPAAAPRPPASATRTRTNGKKANTEARSLDPRLRFDWLKGSEDTKYSGTGRNIFQTYVEIPKPIVPPVQQPTQIVQQGPPPPPPPPPINLKFFGFASRPGESKKIFLSEGEDIFIAGEGQIVDRRYKVLRISANDVEIEDVLNNNRQSIPLTQG
jgi:hypothetical protein